jgi:hypothetical protein
METIEIIDMSIISMMETSENRAYRCRKSRGRFVKYECTTITEFFRRAFSCRVFTFHRGNAKKY